jgi:hypothetical protein
MRLSVKSPELVYVFIESKQDLTFKPDADPDPDTSFQINDQTNEKVIK